MIRRTLAALALGALAAFVGCAAQPEAIPGTATPAPVTAPTTTPAPTPTPAPSPSPRPQAPAITQVYPDAPTEPARDISARDWAKIAKNPDQHVGEHIIVYGYVTQFDSATGSAAFRANVEGDKMGQWYDYDTNTYLAGSPDMLGDLVQDDIFRAEAQVLGSYSYTTTMGGTMTVPHLRVTKIDVIGSTN